MNSKVLHNATKQNYGNRTSDCSFHDCSKIGPSNIHFVYADANCEKAGVGDPNCAGNNKGNVKQCSGPFLEGPKEPVRTCDSANSGNTEKDNDGDGFADCKDRGSN